MRKSQPPREQPVENAGEGAERARALCEHESRTEWNYADDAREKLSAGCRRMAEREQERQPEQREAGLTQDRQSHVRYEARRRVAAMGDLTPYDAIGDDLAADARHGQQAVDRFANPGRPGDDAHAWTLQLGQEPSPREGVGDHRQDMEERGEHQ